jgi:hypothetical protein
VREEGMKNVYRLGVFVFICAATLLCSHLLVAGTAPYIELLNPKRGEEILFGSEIVIAFSIYDVDGDTDTSTVELTVDNRDVTGEANISALLITYRFPQTTVAGRHTFSLSIGDREGKKSELTSYFSIAPQPQKERRYTANGSVRAGAEYDKEGDPNLIGVVNVNVYGSAFDSFDYALSVDLTNDKDSDEQRVSQYRFDLSSGFGSLVLGDTTPVFSSYMIDGREVFGVHVLPQFGPIGFELLFGQSYKAVEELDIYKQMVYGFRFKAGNARRFLWALSFLKVKDDKDSITTLGETPKDNIVLGTDFNLALMGGLLKLQGEANESLLNEDITSGASDFPDYELPFNPDDWEWLFTINEHIVPYVPGLGNLATKLSLELGPLYGNSFNAEYSYIGPSYFSLGNDTLANDKAGIKLWDSIWLLDRQLFLSGAFERYRNNLEDTEINTTKSTGYSLSSYIYPTDVLSLNAGFDLLTVSDGATVDTMNTTLNAGVSRSLELLRTNSSAYLTFSAGLYKDKIDDANSANDFSTRLGLISYFNDFPLDTKASVGYDFGDVDDSLYLEGRAGYRFLPEETLYAFTDLIYETGLEQLDLTVGTTFDVSTDIKLEGDLEYITSPSSSDLFISAFATKEF